jgi:hypothetical protein
LEERSPTNSCVLRALGVFKERLKTIGGVSIGEVVFQRLRPGGRILATLRETKERLKTKGRVVSSVSQSEEGTPSSLSDVLAGI